MGKIRLNIVVSEALLREIESMAGVRKRSRFITEAIERHIESLKREQTEKLMAEGYRARKEESRAIAEEFEIVDSEGWDEY